MFSFFPLFLEVTILNPILIKNKFLRTFMDVFSLALIIIFFRIVNDFPRNQTSKCKINLLINLPHTEWDHLIKLWWEDHLQLVEFNAGGFHIQQQRRWTFVVIQNKEGWFEKLPRRIWANLNSRNKANFLYSRVVIEHKTEDSHESKSRLDLFTKFYESVLQAGIRRLMLLTVFSPIIAVKINIISNFR